MGWFNNYPGCGALPTRGRRYSRPGGRRYELVSAGRSYGLVQGKGGAFEAGFDEAVKELWAGVTPAEVFATMVAVAIGPGVAGEPGVLQCRRPRFVAGEGFREGDDSEGGALRISKKKLVLSTIGKALAVGGHAVEAPGAEPVIIGFGKAEVWARVGLGNHEVICCRKFRFHKATYARAERSQQPGRVYAEDVKEDSQKATKITKSHEGLQ